MALYKTTIIYDDEARAKIIAGAHKIAKVVGSTLGPRGTNVAITRAVPPNMEVVARDVIHDGVGVARAVDLEDENENMGAMILKEASQKQVDLVGDGTTAVMVLADAIITEAQKHIAAGVSPMSLRSELELGLSKLQKELEKHRIPLKTLAEYIHIATISSEDKELGKLIAEVLNKIGVDGVVAIEESRNSDTQVVYQDGMQFDKGYAHELFITHPEERIATLQNPYLLITDKDITSLEDLGPLLNSIHDRQASLVIISPSIGGEALPLLVQNKLAGKLSNLCIFAPSFGDNQKNILQDIALLTGARYISQDAGHTFKDITLKDLGKAESITSTKTDTVIVGGRGDKKLLDQRIKGIKKLIPLTDQEFDKEKLKERYAKLTGGVAVIHVGGQTEIEMKERKERVDDAVHALRAAMQEGIVTGGEIIYLLIRRTLGTTNGEKILYKALEAPFNRLVENAGYNSGQIRERLGLLPTKGFGFDVTRGTIENMIKEGIVDPLLVPKHALANAISTSVILITTGAVINPIEKKYDKMSK